MKKHQSQQSKENYFNKTALRAFFAANSAYIVTIVLVALSIWVFVPQLSNLKSSIEAVKDANVVYVLIATIVFCIGFPVTAYKYCVLPPKRLKYLLTLQVQIASGFISKLLPMSIGSLTVNTYYLTVSTKSVAIAGSTMALNAITSSIAFSIILIFALFADHANIAIEATQSHSTRWGLIAGLTLVLGYTAWYFIHSKQLIMRIRTSGRAFWERFKEYKNNPEKVVAGVVLNGAASITGITTLYLCTHAVGLDVSFADAVLSYTLGNIIGSLVPTPGGLGGTEAGLYGGLVVLGYNSELSLVAVLIYRLISYWLPIVPGYFMYRHLKQTTLSSFQIKRKQTVASQPIEATA